VASYGELHVFGDGNWGFQTCPDCHDVSKESSGIFQNPRHLRTSRPACVYRGQRSIQAEFWTSSDLK
jgi:hypothetical protein